MSSTAFQQVPREGLLPKLPCTQDTQAAPRGAADPQPFPSLHPQSCSGVEFSLIPPQDPQRMVCSWCPQLFHIWLLICF